MQKSKTQKSVASKTSFMALLMIIIGMAIIALFGFFMHRNEVTNARAEEALSIAQSIEPLINEAEMTNIMGTLETNEYWETLLTDLDEIKASTDVAYLYVITRSGEADWQYFIEGKKPDESRGDLGQLGEVEKAGVFHEAADEAYASNTYTTTEIYNSEGFGYMVGGFAPVTDDAGNVLGVIGVDISVDEVNQASMFFGLLTAAIVIAFSIISGLFFRKFVNKTVGAPVNALADASQKIAVGDMNVQLSYNSEDEIGTLSQSFMAMAESTKHQVSLLEEIADGDLTVTPEIRSEKDSMSLAMQKMIDNLKNMVSKINVGTQQVMSGSKQVADGATALAQGSIEQASVVTELSDSIGNVAIKTKENTTKAKTAADLTQNIRGNAEAGSTQMQNLMQAVEEINEASQNIGRIIKVIDDIAFQTNILALNAAVEAARAGEHGKGFAVVADEVRNLAAKSADAAKESGVMITNSIEKAEEGAKIAQVTSESLSDIVDGINESTDLIREIAESSINQNSAIEHINSGIDNVSQVVQQNSATAQQSAAASQEMSGQAEMLHELVSVFKVEQNDDDPTIG